LVSLPFLFGPTIVKLAFPKTGQLVPYAGVTDTAIGGIAAITVVAVPVSGVRHVPAYPAVNGLIAICVNAYRKQACCRSKQYSEQYRFDPEIFHFVFS